MLAYLRDRKFWHAAAVLVGTMVGVGIYGIPFAFAKAGFWVGAAWLVGLSVLVGMTHLLLAELTLSTEGKHQLTGYANIWLGPWGRRAMTFATVLTIYGALLAYLIVFGQFASNILSHFFAVDPQFYSWLFAAGWSLLWLVRLRTMAVVETVLVTIYAGIIIFIIIFCLPHAHLANLGGWTPSSWFLPYGVLLFALGAATAIPLQRELLVGRERLMRPAIIWGSVFAVLLYLGFAAAVVSVSGPMTSPEALNGFYGLVPTGVILLGSLLGAFTISTSYIALGTAMYETFRLDYHLKAPGAWLLTVIPPLFFFWSGLRSFIDVIGLVGAVAGGLQGILLLAAYLKSRKVRLRQPEFHMRVPTVLVWFLMLIFASGVAYAIWVR